MKHVLSQELISVAAVEFLILLFSCYFCDVEPNSVLTVSEIPSTQQCNTIGVHCRRKFTVMSILIIDYMQRTGIKPMKGADFVLTRCFIDGAPPPFIMRQMDPNNASLVEWASLFKPLYYKTFHWTSWSADPDCLNFEK